MDILFIVPYVPSLIRVRPYNLIRYLTLNGHKVTVMTVWTDEQDKKSVEELKDHCSEVKAVHLPRWRSYLNTLKVLPSQTPLQAAYCWHPKLSHQTSEFVARSNGKPSFDVIHVEHLRGARYGLYIKSNMSTSQSRLPIVWDSVDSISYLFRQTAALSKSVFGRWLARFELIRTERYESWLINQFDHTLVTSPADKQAFLSLVQASKNNHNVSVLPNGVDSTYFKPDIGTLRDEATVVVSGKMSYHANVTMVLNLVNHIMPHVWSSRSDVKLCIVGKDPPKSIRSLADNPMITVTGNVSDVRPYLQRATVALAPITYGAGIQNKVLEAMACATPVVATPQAVSALDVVPGRDILLEEEPVAFAEAVITLLNDPRLQKRIGLSGRHYVENHHQWAYIVDQLEEIYQGVIQANSSLQRKSMKGDIDL